MTPLRRGWDWRTWGAGSVSFHESPEPERVTATAEPAGGVHLHLHLGDGTDTAVLLQAIAALAARPARNVITTVVPDDPEAGQRYPRLAV